jgi:hypothetical protein
MKPLGYPFQSYNLHQNINSNGPNLTKTKLQSNKRQYWWVTFLFKDFWLSEKESLYSGMWCRAIWYIGTNVSEKPATSVFKVDPFYPEDGGSRFLRNRCTYLSNYMAAHDKRQSSTQSQLWEPQITQNYIIIIIITKFIIVTIIVFIHSHSVLPA